MKSSCRERKKSEKKIFMTTRTAFVKTSNYIYHKTNEISHFYRNLSRFLFCLGSVYWYVMLTTSTASARGPPAVPMMCSIPG